MSLKGNCNPVGSPAWTRNAAIGDYGGATDKIDCESENPVPYTLAVYRSLVAQRGTGYSPQVGGTLVHVENLALARSIACAGHRSAEKLRANATPAKSDERLDYWVSVLGVPLRSNEERWQLRLRCSAHYRASVGGSYQVIRDAISGLLGDAFVDLVSLTGSALSSPPANTYWPVINPGPAGFNLGGGTWYSDRASYTVKVTHPSRMSDAEFSELIYVQLFHLLDRILPIWAKYTVQTV